MMHTLERLHSSQPHARMILVLPQQYYSLWQGLCKEHSFKLTLHIVFGGETRFHSVKNGLSVIPEGEDGVVGVHDGVRPFVSAEVIADCMAAARKTGAALPAVKPVESVRIQQDGDVTVPFNRDKCLLVQTPQCFSVRLLRCAYQQDYIPDFTDDASVVEALGHQVTIVDGNRENIKLTNPSDLLWADVLLKNS